jgi:3-deoxy-D-manno-octulosonate 8-phosphate phosphatase (KDO 8-P phosphatase)
MAESETGVVREEVAVTVETMPESQPPPVQDSGLATRATLQPAAPRERLAAVRLLAMDVDGVLTDGTILWSARPQGGPLLESKAFSVKDGLGLSLARVAGLQVAWITGRTSHVVERRAVELGVTELHQWARHKGLVLEEIKNRHALSAAAVAFVGDDLNDVPAFQASGLRIAVADAAPELQAMAHWVTRAPGGRGAIREVVEAILRAQGRWDEIVTRFYQHLEQEAGQ